MRKSCVQGPKCTENYLRRFSFYSFFLFLYYHSPKWNLESLSKWPGRPGSGKSLLMLLGPSRCCPATPWRERSYSSAVNYMEILSFQNFITFFHWCFANFVKVFELIFENYKSDYFYYFYNKFRDEHIYSETYDEHLKAVNKYQK